MEIKGKLAVVVGGASGMGRATAELLAARGAHVAILDRPGGAGKEVASTIGGTFYEADITDHNGIEETLAAATQTAQGARQIAAAAEQAGAASRQAATASTEQARGAEDLAAAIEEIASLADELKQQNG